MSLAVVVRRNHFKIVTFFVKNYPLSLYFYFVVKSVIIFTSFNAIESPTLFRAAECRVTVCELHRFQLKILYSGQL